MGSTLEIFLNGNSNGAVMESPRTMACGNFQEECTRARIASLDGRYEDAAGHMETAAILWETSSFAGSAHHCRSEVKKFREQAASARRDATAKPKDITSTPRSTVHAAHEILWNVCNKKCFMEGEAQHHEGIEQMDQVDHQWLQASRHKANAGTHIREEAGRLHQKRLEDCHQKGVRAEEKARMLLFQSQNQAEDVRAQSLNRQGIEHLKLACDLLQKSTDSRAAVALRAETEARSLAAQGDFARAAKRMELGAQHYDHLERLSNVAECNREATALRKRADREAKRGDATTSLAAADRLVEEARRQAGEGLEASARQLAAKGQMGLAAKRLEAAARHHDHASPSCATRCRGVAQEFVQRPDHVETLDRALVDAAANPTDPAKKAYIVLAARQMERAARKYEKAAWQSEDDDLLHQAHQARRVAEQLRNQIGS